MKMIKHYVEFAYPGIVVTETNFKNIKARDPMKVEKDNESFGFRFFDRVEEFMAGEELLGKKKNYSGWYYQGEIFTKKDVEERVDGNHTLLWNMRVNKYPKVVKTKFGQFIPLEKGDCIFDM